MSLIIVASPPAEPDPEGPAEADFLFRSTQPGVIWAHDFAAAAEVTQFRENGDLYYDPDGDEVAGPGYVQNTCYHITSDSVSGGGCMEILRPAGTSDGFNWYRPMSPLSSPGNGRATDDPAANGSIALDAGGAWGPPVRPAQTSSWFDGNWGPASTGTWDGDQFFIQYKLKVSASRDNGVFGGKVAYITRMNQSLTAQELVPSYDYTPKKWRIYSGGTGTIQNELHPANVRSTPSDNDIPEEHYWDEWVEYLIHVVPGGENDSAGGSAPRRGQPVTQPGDTRVNVWQRREGATGYTHIFQQNFHATDYVNSYQQAWNAIILSGYFNSANMPQDFTQRFDEVIFSHKWIPPGRTAAASVLETAADALSAGQRVLDPITWNPSSSTYDISWQNRTAFYDEGRGEIQYMGKAQAGGWARHFRYLEATDSWAAVNEDVAGSLGHIWITSFDHAAGNYYHVQHTPSQSPRAATRTINYYDRSANAWTQAPVAAFDVWNNSATPNPGLVYHPNLLGPGRPGVFCWGSNRFSYFDTINQSWTSVRSGIRYISPYNGSTSNGWRQNSSIYIPGLDLGMFGSGQTDGGYSGGIPLGLFIQAGDADNLNPATATMPIGVTNEDYSGGAHMLLDPRDTTKSTVMLLERTGSRVWTSNNPMAGAGAWTLESFTHPFFSFLPYHRLPDTNNHGSWTCCSIPRYGVVLGMGSEPPGGSMMWRPG